MNRLSCLPLITFSLLTITSCKKADVDLNNNNNAPSGSTAANDFNWQGEAPFSLKKDDTFFHASYATAAASTNGVTVVLGVDAEGGTNGFSLNFPTNAKPGSTYLLVNDQNGALSHYNNTDPNNPINFISVSGKVRVVQNDANVVSGFFYATLKNADASKGSSVEKITEGYFKVKRQ